MRHAVGAALILVWGTTCAPQAGAADTRDIFDLFEDEGGGRPETDRPRGDT